MLKVAKNTALCNAPMGVPADDDEDGMIGMRNYVHKTTQHQLRRHDARQWSIHVGPDFDLSAVR
jgi:hypothetical protein